MFVRQVYDPRASEHIRSVLKKLPGLRTLTLQRMSVSGCTFAYLPSSVDPEKLYFFEGDIERLLLPGAEPDPEYRERQLDFVIEYLSSDERNIVLFQTMSVLLQGSSLEDLSGVHRSSTILLYVKPADLAPDPRWKNEGWVVVDRSNLSREAIWDTITASAYWNTIGLFTRIPAGLSSFEPHINVITDSEAKQLVDKTAYVCLVAYDGSVLLFWAADASQCGKGPA